MIFPRDIFTDFVGYVKFILYIYSNITFTAEILSSQFNIGKWVIYKHLRYWEKQEYITIISMVGEKGGKQYLYQITDRLKNQLKKSIMSLQNSLEQLKKKED